MTIPCPFLFLLPAVLLSWSPATGAAPSGRSQAEVSLDALCRRAGARIASDDPFGRVVLEKGLLRATISPGVGFLLLGERAIPVETAPRRDGSGVWIPAESAKLLEGFFRGPPPAPRAGLRAPSVEPPRRQAPAPVVLIDPGHGGRDPGTNRAGVREKDIVLAVGRALVAELRRAGMRARLTREGDESLGGSQDASLASRVDIAGEILPDAFVSLHVDATASEVTQAQGFTIYVPPSTFRERRLGNRAFDAFRRGVYTAGRRAFHGRAVGRAGEVRGTLAGTLYGLFFEDNVILSRRLGHAIEGELGRVPGMRTRGIQENDLYVLKWGWSPSVLVELGYLNNPAEREKLLSTSHRRDLARALARGVVRFLRESGKVAA